MNTASQCVFMTYRADDIMGLKMDRSSPSKSLYFSEHLRDAANIVEESINTITLDDRVICFRIPSREELRKVVRNRRHVVTVVDDHYWGIVRDKRLPFGYRARMFTRLTKDWQRLKQVTHEWVVTSPVLGRLYPGASMIDPNWDIAFDPGELVNRDGLHIGFLGTRSHLHDLETILAGVISFLQNFPAARFTLFMGKHCPKELLTLSNVTNYDPMNWQEYRKLLSGLEIDISLLPSQNTQVNKCRSRNKLFEAVYAGGFCLFDEGYAHKGYAAKHQLGLPFRKQHVAYVLETYMNELALLSDVQSIAKTNALELQKQIVNKQKKVLLGVNKEDSC